MKDLFAAMCALGVIVVVLTVVIFIGAVRDYLHPWD